MIKISKQNNSLIVEGIDNVFYPNNGDNSYPLNSLIVVTDNSDMATFRSVATNDVLFSGLIQNITINGEAVTKDNIIEKFDTVSNSSTGGGGSTVDAYTKEESDNKFATKTELTNVQTVANDADTKVDALTTRVEGVETTMGNKQDTLVSGTNIKTINNQSILGEGNIEITGSDVDLTNYYTKTEADEIFATTTQVNHQAADISALETDMRGKQATLVSGENIKTINSQSILGSGDLAISGVSDEQAQEIAKIPTLETSLNNKQDTLVSGANIKTINNQSILGEGNIEITGGNVDLTNYYTKTESDTKFSTKDELTAVETVANNADAKADAATSRVESVETSLDNKQDTLVSGTNIKTINSESILGEGNITTGPKTYIVKEINENLDDKLREAINALKNGVDFSKQVPYSNSITQLFKRLVINDYLKVDTWAYTGLLEYSGQVSNCYRFRVNIYGEQLDSNNFTTNIVIMVNDSYKSIYIYTNNGGFCAKIQDIPSVVTEKGESTTAVMSQKAVTDELNTLSTAIENIPSTDLSNYYNKTEVDTKLDTKQNTLVSGTNIKTINGESVLGEGNLVIEGGGSTPVKHTINLGTNDPGKAYNETGNGTIFLSLTVDQYDIDSINVNDEVDLTWENSGKTVNGIVKEGYFTSDGQKLKYITTSFKIEDGDFEVRNIVFYNNTSIYVFPIVAPTENTTSPTVYCVKGVTDNQTTKWDNAAKLKNYYDYKIGTKDTIPSIDNNFKGIIYRNNMMGTKVDVTFNRYTQFKAARSLAEAITYTIGKSTTTGLPLIQEPYGGKNVTINDDGSWTIPTTNSETSNQMYYNSVIYANGEIIKNAGTNVGVTFHVGDRIQVTNEHFPGAGLFRDFMNQFDSTKINISYKGIINTDATNQLLNQFNGNSYNIRSEANEWTGTQSEFDALTTKDNNIIYYVTE